MPTSSNSMHVSSIWRLLRLRSSHFVNDDVDDLELSLGLEETPLPKMLRLSMIVFSVATFLFIFWAAITPVKELSKTQGQVVPTGYNQIVQHLEGGLVRQILVHEGDFVQQGQLLVALDGAGTEEDLKQQEALVQSLSMQQERLKALIEGRKPDFSKTSANSSEVAEQTRMYSTARDARSGERSILIQQIEQKKLAISRLEQSLDTANANLKVAQENRDIYAGLEKKGMASRTTLLAKEQDLNSSAGNVGNINKQISEAQRELSEYQSRLSATSVQQKDSAYTELDKVQSDLAQAQEDLKKRWGRVNRLEVHAPVAGYIKGLKLNTVGSVIPAGQTLMEIVPADEQLIVEVRIPTQQIGRVSVGQKAQVKVDSYDYIRFGMIEGTLDSISAMTFTDANSHQEYYKGRVKLANNYIGNNPGANKIIPGMTVDADIVIGEKAVLAYLLKPIRSAIHNSLTEQ